MTKTVRDELRDFGRVIGFGFILLSILAAWRGRSDYIIIFLLISMTFLLLAYLFPSSLKWPQFFWMKLALVLGWINTRIILFVLFYLILAPCGILYKIMNKPYKQLRFDASAVTYWKNSAAVDPKASMMKQY